MAKPQIGYSSARKAVTDEIQGPQEDQDYQNSRHIKGYRNTTLLDFTNFWPVLESRPRRGVEQSGIVVAHNPKVAGSNPAPATSV